jgi:hypothetical protein
MTPGMGEIGNIGISISEIIILGFEIAKSILINILSKFYRLYWLNWYKTDISKTYDTICFDTKCNQCHFKKISNHIGFVYFYQIDTDFLPIEPFLTFEENIASFFSYQCSQDLEM